ncbi:MAG: hypothetical protein V4508_19695 [Pseudomonadota bacterium]
MIDFFKRGKADEGAAALGTATLALEAGAVLAPACVGVLCDATGATRRIEPGARIKPGAGERAICFHPGPYRFELAPFAGAPEIGLRLLYAVGAADPRVAQQRFDLYLASEAQLPLAAVDFGRAMETAVRRELEQGNLTLPPCTTLEEWHLFRAGLNQLLYTRFGVMVDDCIPVDLGESVDYAQLLLARAECAPPVLAQAAVLPASDALALRRLFLELPGLMGALRQVVLAPGLFGQHQALLQRLDLACLSVGTMPALELAAPGQPLAPLQQQRRTRHSVRASAALDEAWALLARLNRAAPDQLAALLDDADRIAANLELDLAARRTCYGEAA